jgi:glycosyltransferase involved in cell wall biosynthesis
VRNVHVVVLEGIDDPARPSGGNAYDRRVCRGLAALGWEVHEHGVPGDWPRPGAVGHAALARALRGIPDGAVVLLDGLIASAAPEELVPQARRLRQVVLVHMPLGHRPPGPEVTAARAREREVLSGAVAVVTTSAWTRRRLVELYELPADRIHVAEPGVDAAGLAPGTAAGDALLCVAAVTPDKGHDVLLDALETASDLSWRLACVGSLDREPDYADVLRRRARHNGLDGRVRFAGARTGPELDRAYAEADLFVLASHAETYGMVVTEALARGLPVVAAEVGGVTEALGHADDGTRPGMLVPPGDPDALGAALRAWLGDAELRGRLRRAARERRAALRGWPATASVLADVLEAAAAAPVRVSPEWLVLREPADAAARSSELAERLRRRLPAAGPLEIHDLGGGSGAMARWLAPRLPGPQHWVVHDRDADLLEIAAADRPGPGLGGAAVTVEARRSDVTRLDPPDLAGASAIVASALLDMLTVDELAGVLRTCIGVGCPVLLALTVVGRVELTPAEPVDERIAAAFNAHQRRTGPAGGLLGPDAVAAAVDELSGTGAEVLVRPSPWRLGATEPDLIAAWFVGWVAAACEQESGLAGEAAVYRDRRLAQAAAGELAVTVGHADLLVLP